MGWCPLTNKRGCRLLGIVIVAHGELAREYLSAGEYVVGFKTNIKTITKTTISNTQIDVFFSNVFVRFV